MEFHNCCFGNTCSTFSSHPNHNIVTRKIYKKDSQLTNNSEIFCMSGTLSIFSNHPKYEARINDIKKKKSHRKN